MRKLTARKLFIIIFEEKKKIKSNGFKSRKHENGCWNELVIVTKLLIRLLFTRCILINIARKMYGSRRTIVEVFQKSILKRFRVRKCFFFRRVLRRKNVVLSRCVFIYFTKLLRFVRPLYVKRYNSSARRWKVSGFARVLKLKKIKLTTTNYDYHSLVLHSLNSLGTLVDKASPIFFRKSLRTKC